MLRLFHPTCARALLIATSLLAASTTGFAQRSGGEMGRGGGAMTDVELGSAAPDVQVFDAKGQERSLRGLLKGHTTAIVFGCLT